MIPWTARAFKEQMVTPEVKNKVVQSLIRKQGKENIPKIIDRDMVSDDSLTPEIAADVMTQNQWTRQELRNLQRAQDNVGGRKLFNNEKKVYAAISQQSKLITEDSFIKTKLQLQSKRQGQEKMTLTNRPLVYPKSFKDHLHNIISEEAENQDFERLDDGTLRVIVGLTADAGGGSNKFSIR